MLFDNVIMLISHGFADSLKPCARDIVEGQII